MRGVRSLTPHLAILGLVSSSRKLTSPEPLSHVEGSYVNFESAVNPEYYNKLRIKDKDMFELPRVHRKLGLSTPNEVLVYQGWLVEEIENYRRFLGDYVCLSKRMCVLGQGVEAYILGLISQNQLLKEEFLFAIFKSEFLGFCDNIVEIYDKFYDVGYCGFEDIGKLRPKIISLREKLASKNRTRFAAISREVVMLYREFKSYLEKCKNAPKLPVQPHYEPPASKW